MLQKLVIVLGLAIHHAACLDEIEEEPPAPLPAPIDDTADATDGIPSGPDLPEDETCAAQKKADGACVP